MEWRMHGVPNESPNPLIYIFMIDDPFVLHFIPNKSNKFGYWQIEMLWITSFSI